MLHSPSLRFAAARTIALAAAGLIGCGSTGSGEGYALMGATSTGVGGSGGSGASTSTSSPSTTGGTTSTTSTTSSTSSVGLGPPYPVVLAHGFFGFDKFAGLDFVTYFYGVKAALAAENIVVYTPAVDPFNDSTVRGAQLAAAIQKILAETGYAKVNLIGHSQGGLDARVVAHDHPELIASVVTVGTPHYGTPIADVALKLVGDPALKDVLDWIVNAIGAPLYDELGETTAVSKPLELFSQPGIKAFNQKYPNAPTIPYFSIAGRSNKSDGGLDCKADVKPSFIGAFDSINDPLDPMFALFQSIPGGGLVNTYPNDGLVRVKDARWGTFLGCIPADHMDEMGQLLGDAPGAGNTWDHVAFYRDVIGFLRDQGY
jgi:triacylglycerol lipase